MNNYIKILIKILQELIALSLNLMMIPIIIREIIQRKKVTIILYHQPSPKVFEKHLKYLSRNYSIISLDEYIKAKMDNKINELPPKSIVITFDDGYSTNYQLKEIIQKFKVPITIFCCKEFDHDAAKYYNERIAIKDFEKNIELLSDLEIFDLINIGVHIQSHTLTHPLLPMCNEIKAGIEILKSKTELEKKFNIKVNYMSYPYGAYSLREIEFCKKAGYTACLTVDAGFNGFNTNSYTLKRFGANDEASINQFTVRITGVWLVVKSIFNRTGI